MERLHIQIGRTPYPQSLKKKVQSGGKTSSQPNRSHSELLSTIMDGNYDLTHKACTPLSTLAYIRMHTHIRSIK